MEEQMEKFPRIMIGGTHSGSGKTSVTAALLMAFKNRKIKTAPYKCGPDYIDPMFHKYISGVPSINLDRVFLNNRQIIEIFNYHMRDRDFALCEGVMGYYDGQGSTDRASSYDLARHLKMPVVLVVRPEGTALSIAALVKGFQSFRQPSMIQGVILNGIRKGMYPFYRDMIEREAGVKVFGFLPNDPEIALESRHLGLVTEDQQKNLDFKLKRLGQLAEENIDIDGLLRLGEAADELIIRRAFQSFTIQSNVRLAVAADRAFCFYYEDNLECFRKMGVELVYFSPMTDKRLPENIQGIYFGGGYPELYGAELSQNRNLMQEVRDAYGKIPILAECGGYMYLTESLTDLEGRCWPMVGVLKGRCAMGEHLAPFGYVQLHCSWDSLLGKAENKIPGHEFHYSYIIGGDKELNIEKNNGRSWKGGKANSKFYGGYPHLYFYSCPEIVYDFIKAMEAYRDDL